MSEDVNAKLDAELKAAGIEDEPITEADAPKVPGEADETLAEAGLDNINGNIEVIEPDGEPETPKEPEPPKVEEESKKQEAVRPPKYKPLPEYLEEKNKWKAERENLLAEVENLKNATTPEARIEAADDITQAIEDLREQGLDVSPDVLKTLTDVISKRVLPKDSLEAIEKAKKTSYEQEQSAIFNNEWTKLESSLKTQYPNASQSQIDEAKKEMDKMAHTEQFHKFDLDYVLFKNQKAFDVVLNTKAGKSFESGKIQNYDKPVKNAFLDFDEETATTDQLIAAEAEMRQMAKTDSIRVTDSQGKVVQRK